MIAINRITVVDLTFAECEMMADDRKGERFALRISPRRFTYYLEIDGTWTFRFVEVTR